MLPAFAWLEGDCAAASPNPVVITNSNNSDALMPLHMRTLRQRVGLHAVPDGSSRDTLCKLVPCLRDIGGHDGASVPVSFMSRLLVVGLLRVAVRSVRLTSCDEVGDQRAKLLRRLQRR